MSFECDGKSRSIASSHKFALRFAFECDLKMARVSAIYTNNSFYTFTQDFIQIWQVHHMKLRIFLNVCFVFYCLLFHVSFCLVIRTLINKLKV